MNVCAFQRLQCLIQRDLAHKIFLKKIKIVPSLSSGVIGRTYSDYENNNKDKRQYNAFRSDLSSFSESVPELDWDYLLNPANVGTIKSLVKQRKGVGDIDEVHRLWKEYKELVSLNEAETEETYLDGETTHFKIQDFLQSQENDVKVIVQNLVQAAADIPNMTHPETPIGDESHAKLIATVGKKRVFDFKPSGVEELGCKLDCLRTDNLALTTGTRNYYFKGLFAQLQTALVNYTIDVLKSKGFEMVYVPDLIHPSIIESCGFKARGERTQVYHLDPSSHGLVSLAGTGEMPLAGMYKDTNLSLQQLPKKCMTVSKCYRAEVSNIDHERGIYRVHEFTKVEMFGVTSKESGRESESLVEEFLNIQKYIFSQLGLHFRILEMPSEELGSPAYRKFDMEAWMPHKEFWGEISSTSNCLDYQSRRLNIKYWGDSDEQPSFVHTVNGTACAVPRMIMAISENYQNINGEIEIPAVLQPYMRGQSIISRGQNPLEMHWITLTKLYKKKLTRT